MFCCCLSCSSRHLLVYNITSDLSTVFFKFFHFFLQLFFCACFSNKSGKRFVGKETKSLRFKPRKSLLIYADSSLAFFMLNYHEYHPAASTSTVPVQKSIAIVTILKFLSWPVQSLLSGPNCK